MSTPERPHIPTGRETETRRVAKGIHDALSALQDMIKAPGETRDAKEQEAYDKAEENLVKSFIMDKNILDAIVSGKAFDNPTLMAAIEEASKGADANAILTIMEAQHDLAELGDEINSLDRYIESTKPKSVYQQITNAIDSNIAKRLPLSRIKQIAASMKLDITDEQGAAVIGFITAMMKNVFASMIEKIPGMESTSGNLRFDAALAKAKTPDGGLTEEQRTILETPDGLARIKSEWIRLYKTWLKNKKIDEKNNIAPGPAPTIADVFAGREQKLAQENSENLFGIPGLKTGEEMTIEQVTNLPYSGKELSVHVDGIALAGNKRLFKESVGTVSIIAPDANIENAKIRVVTNNKFAEITVKDLFAELNTANSTDEVEVDTDPPLTLKAVS